MEITEANFEAEVLLKSNEVPVVVVLWSPRSDASVQLGDALASLAATDAGKWSLVNVNVDTTPRVAQIFGVQAVPTVVALAGGTTVVELPGPATARSVARVDRLAAERHRRKARWRGAVEGDEPEQVDPELAQARSYLDAGDFDAALAAYQKILDADPTHEEAKGAVRQIAFLARASALPPEAVATADAAPDDIEAALAAADVEILQQNVAAAFDRLIALVRRTAGDERASVRTRLVELFDLFDPADPEVIAGRRNLANALY